MKLLCTTGPHAWSLVTWWTIYLCRQCLAIKPAVKIYGEPDVSWKNHIDKKTHGENWGEPLLQLLWSNLIPWNCDTQGKERMLLRRWWSQLFFIIINQIHYFRLNSDCVSYLLFGENERKSRECVEWSVVK